MMFAPSPLVSIFPIVLMLLMGGGGGMPLGVPPLPEDPVLSCVAPEQCLVYMSCSGMATPDAKSKNQTEQLLAEPEVQRLWSEIEQVIVAGTREGTPREQAEVARDAIRWGKWLLTRPVAAFVSSVGPSSQGLDVQGGLIVNVGGDAAELKAAMEKYQALLPGGAEKVEVAGMSCYRLKVGPGMPPVTWGISSKGNYLLIGVGEGSLEGIRQRARGAAPAWLTALRKQLPVERPSMVTYVNVEKLVMQFGPLGGANALSAMTAAGLGNVTSLSAVSGLDGDGMVTRMLVGIKGEPAGVFSIAAGQPLSAADLAPIPRDANFALAARVDASQVLETILRIAGKIDPQDPEEFNANLKQLKQQTGVDLRQDVLASLDDVWCAYNSPDEGGLILTGLTGVVRVKDYDRLSAAQAKLLAAAKAALGQDAEPATTTEKAVPTKRVLESAPGAKTAEEQEREEEAAMRQPRFGPPPRPRTRIEQLHFAGQDIYFVSGGNGLPFAPAWCLTPKELIVALFPQQIKAYLTRGADFKSLATAADVAALVRPGEAPVALSYFDGRKLLDYLYPMVCMGMQTVSGELARERIGLNVSIIPSAPAIYKHLRPSSTVVRRVEGGIEVISRGTLPGSSLTLAAPMAAYYSMSALPASRNSARRVQSMNNMKQISLAMISYQAALGTFPPAYIADKKTGKPLLSWRVAILPYLDRMDIYNQFHLDEPWDSPHNKRLSDTVIAVYRSPNSHSKGNMTNYLTVRGDDTAFPGKEGIGPGDITDGTSNTIMVVEASDEKAVPWAKPDDLPYDDKHPAAGLVGLWPGSFNVAFCDGSVRSISATIDAETLRRLFNRHDGKPVDPRTF
ncbi:MAG: DUF1559 domain-containing protein [Thermoguttaceae bacterium]